MSKTLYDLRSHSSVDLEILIIGLQSGADEAKKFSLTETQETLLAFKKLAEAAKRDALENEADLWAREQARDILGTIDN